MQYHNDRAPGEHLNPDIDPERTHLNYELHDAEGCYLPRKYAAEVDAKIAANRTSGRKVRKALSRLVDNPIAHAALAVRQNVARWVEKDARAADRVIKREVKSVRKELGALAAEAQQMRKSGKQLESERSSGRPESRSKGVDR